MLGFMVTNNFSKISHKEQAERMLSPVVGPSLAKRNALIMQGVQSSVEANKATTTEQRISKYRTARISPEFRVHS